jgi:hypothetical protein
VCVCVLFWRFPVSAAWVPKLGTSALSSKIDKIDTTGQLTQDGVIGSVGEESEGVRAEGEQLEWQVNGG